MSFDTNNNVDATNSNSEVTKAKRVRRSLLDQMPKIKYKHTKAYFFDTDFDLFQNFIEFAKHRNTSSSITLDIPEITAKIMHKACNFLKSEPEFKEWQQNQLNSQNASSNEPTSTNGSKPLN